jgi:beta-lactamase class A
MVLCKVDKGELSLDQKVHVVRAKQDSATHSPMLKDHKEAEFDVTIRELIVYTVSHSDNNGCDILFGLAGGCGAVNDYLHGIGIKGISVAATEGEMKKAWDVQYTNWCEPAAMLQLLRDFYNNTMLSKASHSFLMKCLEEGSNPDTRIKGLLPKDARVAHKTGTSFVNNGVIAATNDVGIITLPDGRHFALVVFVSDYTGGYVRGEHMIAVLARQVWDHFMAK